MPVNTARIDLNHWEAVVDGFHELLGEPPYRYDHQNERYQTAVSRRDAAAERVRLRESG